MTASHPRLVRLRRKAREEKRPLAEILQYYAMERFLFRLGVSTHAGAFVLKGAMMLRVRDAGMARPTRDIDFLAFGSNDLDQVVKRLHDICAVPVPDDGILFDLETLRVERIKEGDDYQGARIRFVARLGETRIQMQIDIGFGDVVHPDAEWAEFPILLDDPPPRIRLYSRETAIAEKLHAMVKLASLNSRMKDFHDIAHLSRQGPFEIETLAEAIRKTFQSRGTLVPAEIIAWKAEYVASHAAMWKSYLARTGESGGPEFSHLVEELRNFLEPVLAVVQEQSLGKTRWDPIGKRWF